MIDPNAADRPDDKPLPRGADPERGFRGVMSLALLLQSITVLLGLTVASSGRDMAWWELTLILFLAAACIAACAFVKKPWIVPVILGLQVVAIACWFISAALGAMGLIFAVAWWTLLHFRNEFRRRSAAGVLPSQQANRPVPD